MILQSSQSFCFSISVPPGRVFHNNLRAPHPKASALPNIILCQCGTHLMFLSTNDMKHFLIYSFHTNELFSAMRFREYYKDLKDAF